jgi:SAM-dependent methyltransferase
MSETTGPSPRATRLGAYDDALPAPPGAFVDALCQRAGGSRPALVIDLGCGAGRSTRIWAARADAVLGVDADRRLIRVAAEQGGGAHVRYEVARPARLPVDDGAADIVTCCQAFDTMDPPPTLREVARILRPGGVFASLDFDLPPRVPAKLALAFANATREVMMAAGPGVLDLGRRRWPKTEHVAQLRASRAFAEVEELVHELAEPADPERFVAVFATLGAVRRALERGPAATREPLSRLLALARAELPAGSSWTWIARVRVGVRGA